MQPPKRGANCMLCERQSWASTHFVQVALFDGAPFSVTSSCVSNLSGNGTLMAQSESESYRAFAEDCFAVAQTMTGIQRAHFLEMSAAWHKLAQHQERLEAATNKNVDQQ